MECRRAKTSDQVPRRNSEAGARRKGRNRGGNEGCADQCKPSRRQPLGSFKVSSCHDERPSVLPSLFSSFSGAEACSTLCLSLGRRSMVGLKSDTRKPFLVRRGQGSCRHESVSPARPMFHRRNRCDTTTRRSSPGSTNFRRPRSSFLTVSPRVLHFHHHRLVVLGRVPTADMTISCSHLPADAFPCHKKDGCHSKFC